MSSAANKSNKGSRECPLGPVVLLQRQSGNGPSLSEDGMA
jgi:hypothetical protein